MPELAGRKRHAPTSGSGTKEEPGYRMFAEMEANVERSFLGTHAWQKLRDRWQG